jgi:protocatechuate 3,4-dioxygenase beta subunit
MSRTRLLIAGAVAIAIGLVVVLAASGDRANQRRDPARDLASAQHARAHAAVEPQTVASLPTMALQYDDDPVGDQRLEGQVIDADEQPVAGAVVVVDANPPREIVTEEDGTFAFDGLIPRTYQLAARGADAVAGPVAVRLSPGSEPVVLRLRAAAAIAVDVTGDGDAPIAGALVELRDLAPITVTTDAKGHAELRGVGGGWHVVKASAPGRAAGYQEVTSTGEPGSVTKVSFRLKQGVTVAGTVVDASGAPVEGARVLPQGVARVDDLHDARLDGVVSDAKGRWRLTGLPAETLRLRAYHPGFAPGATPPLTLGDGRDRDGLTITMERGARLRGHVVDGNGNAVPGAELRVAGESPRSGLVRRAVCDAQGRFEITGLPRRTVHAVAIADGATSAVTVVDLARPDVPDLELRVELVGAIAGTIVTRAGAPVGEARVVAEPALADDPLERVRLRLRGPASVIADGDGHFAFTGLEPGSYRVRAIPPGSPSELLDMRAGDKVETGTTDAKIVVDDLAKLTGRVVFADGSAPAQFSITLGGATPRWFGGADGSFTIEGVPTGAQYVLVDGPDLVAVTRTEVTIAAPDTDLGAITVEHGRKVTGLVVDPNGRPAAGATVVVARQIDGDGTELVPYPRAGLEQAVTDTSGRFTIRGIGPGAWEVVADHDVAGRSDAVEIAAGAQDVDLKLVARPTGAVQGFVRLDGQPTDAVVTIMSRSAANTRFHVRTGADGSYRFDRLAAGSYLALSGRARGTRLSGESAVMHKVEVVAGKAVDVDFDEISKGITVVLHIGGDKVQYGFGVIVQLPADFAGPMPTTVAEARQVLADLASSGVEREGLIVKDRAISLTAVPPGRAGACITPLRGDPNDPSVLQEMQDHMVEFPTYCQIVDVAAAPDQQDVTIEVQPLP